MEIAAPNIAEYMFVEFVVQLTILRSDTLKSDKSSK
jgi:hypothetical protein